MPLPPPPDPPLSVLACRAPVAGVDARRRVSMPLHHRARTPQNRAGSRLLKRPDMPRTGKRHRRDEDVVACDHDSMVKLAPAHNAAAKTLRDNGLIGFGFIAIGLGWMALADDRFFRAVALFFLVSGVLTVLPSSLHAEFGWSGTAAAHPDLPQMVCAAASGPAADPVPLSLAASARVALHSPARAPH